MLLLAALFAEICLCVIRNDLSERNRVRAEINRFRSDDRVNFLSFSQGYVWVLKCQARCSEERPRNFKRLNCSPHFKLIVQSIVFHDVGFSTSKCLKMRLRTFRGRKMLCATFCRTQSQKAPWMFQPPHIIKAYQYTL